MKRRSYLPLISVIVSALAAVTARAELVFTNYTSVHPLKMLESGDSITDDSATNGAWRSFLQGLLVTNGYVFTNLGRWASTPTAGFTQVHHEGMDGAVIAAPGLSGPTHGYPAGSNYAQLTLADGLTNAPPDLVLIDLGVNDMGRGRNPCQVATNDLSALLDMVFTKLPLAHVIVSKPTTITYSSILSPPYDTYRTNMLIYCDAVQAVAAARRAKGQNVFVADLFSAVSAGPRMFNGDGTHPNSIGMAAIANEMMFRIAAIMSRPDSVTTPFILGGSVWKYSDQGLDLGTNWLQPNFDDSAWSQGAGRLGYNIVGITSTMGYGNPTNENITTYFRHSFVVPNGVTYTNVNLRLNRADGALVWLNGQELYRVNLPASTITNQTRATALVNDTSDASNNYFPTNLPIAGLPAGTNVIAVEIHKYSPSAGGVTFDLELFGHGFYTPPPTLSFSSTFGNLQLVWPTNSDDFSLQTTTNLTSTNVWQIVPGPYPMSNDSFDISIPVNVGSAQFFRLIKSSQ
ncbi:MAG TPA: GDSL-type esterase/lipase family protein [Verrucomicrobiae bacterium]|jgi:lysophospholipase L1-like esterase|nr:GDSL-type esterase/lipase family protein [Verrucomicrobiae bacterium]